MLINNKKIDRISGPVSFALLKPKMFIFEELKKEGVHLPIFMLFGDVHLSDEKQCEKCSCKLEDSSCCMPIYSEDFLKLIDNMATKEYPIDFGIEGFNLDNKILFKEYGETTAIYFKNLKEEGIIPKLRENIATCYNKELRGTELYEKYCPTKKIRWHYMDARQGSESKYNLENLLFKLGFLEQRIFSTKYTDKKDLKKDIDEVRDNFPSEEIWKLVINLKKDFILDSESGIKSYFYIGEQLNNSLVLKQFNKLSKSFKDLPFWKKALSDYAIYVLKEKRETYSEKLSSDYLKIMDSSRANYYSLLFNYDIEGIFHINGNYGNKLGSYLSKTENSIFFDLYYIFRTFKIPKGDKNPFLSILLAGDAHSQNIKYFLTNIIRYYEVVEDVKIKGDFLGSQDPEMRCTYIPNTNFNELALQYGVKINKPKPLVLSTVESKPLVLPVVESKPLVLHTVESKPLVLPVVLQTSSSGGRKTSPRPVRGAGRKTSPRPVRGAGRKTSPRPVRKTSGRKTSGRKTSGRKTSGRKTSGRKTSGRKTSGRKTSGRKTSGRSERRRK